MAQSEATDATYQLPTPAGNTGPNTDLTQVVNSNGVVAQRQRMESYTGGQTASVTVGEGNVQVSQKQGACVSFLVTTAAGTGQITFYDNPSAANGTVCGIVPANASLGSRWVFNIPVTTGIYGFAATSSAAGTLVFEQ